MSYFLPEGFGGLYSKMGEKQWLRFKQLAALICH